MKEIKNPKTLQREMERLRRSGRTLGFVPTMGALHEGHLSLVRRARRENDVVVVSLFVNPLQFGPKEDFSRYPRSLGEDRRALRQEKVDYLFRPLAPSFYLSGHQTFVEARELSRGLCGRFRPGHFRGVATVVTKLFNLVMPHRAYFGAKDYQQARIVQALVRDLNFNLEIKVLPTLRDRDGLALSSRNRYLSSRERKRALAIPRALAWARDEVRKGQRSLPSLKQGILRRLRASKVRIDYVEFVEPDDLTPVRGLKAPFLIAVAGWVGKTRLIDNAIMWP
ncbi:MAG: pantoate--beta-alanine ligase [Candidatus Omnitrophica bacterium]|nr:pantoate--beta-alanine ligase [Candidatus Omnitrophota bacterium]